MEKILYISQKDYNHLADNDPGTTIKVRNIEGMPFDQKDIVNFVVEGNSFAYPIQCEVLFGAMVNPVTNNKTEIFQKMRKYENTQNENVITVHMVFSYTLENGGEKSSECYYVLKKNTVYSISSLYYNEGVLRTNKYNDNDNAQFYRKDLQKIIINIFNAMADRMYKHYDYYELFWEEMAPSILRYELEAILEFSNDFSKIIGFSILEEYDPWNHGYELMYFERNIKDWNDDLLEASIEAIGSKNVKMVMSDSDSSFLDRRSKVFQDCDSEKTDEEYNVFLNY